MADWFKFYNDALDSKGMQFAISEQPLVTSVWLVIMSEASKNRSCRFAWADQDFELIGFSRKINVSLPVFNQSIGLLERIRYITRKDGFIEIHGWDKLQSDYAKGLDKGYYKNTRKTLASNLLDSRARREERRGEEKRVEDNKETGIHSSNATSMEAIHSEKTEIQLRAEKLFHRRVSTPMSDSERKAFKINRVSIESTSEKEWLLLERFHAAPQSETYARRDLATLFNNWNGELDRAKAWEIDSAHKQKIKERESMKL